MKILVITVLALSILSNSHLIAQNPIYNSHFFSTNVQVEYQPTEDSLIQYMDYGENMTWDYSALPKKGESYKRAIVESKNSPHSNLFPESNLAIEGQNKDYVYLNVQTSKTEFIGFVPPDTSYIVHNYQPWSISIHPMNYQDTIHTPVARYIKIGERLVYREGTVITTAIAEGKLILPNNTYENVLKIKEKQTFYNPTKTTFYQATTYHWLSNESNFPLLSCNIIIDRNSKGEEEITRFAQYIIDEKNTNFNKAISEIEKAKSDSINK